VGSAENMTPSNSLKQQRARFAWPTVDPLGRLALKYAVGLAARVQGNVIVTANDRSKQGFKF
jgi:hypothetical protein